MSRITPLSSVEQYFEIYPTSDPEEKRYVESVYERHPMVSTHPHFAIMMHTPRLADLMMDLTKDMVQLDWVQTPSAHLSILMSDKILGSEDRYMAHLSGSLSAGLTWAQIAALDVPDSGLFNDEERLVMEFTESAITRKVSDEVFDKAKEVYGDKAMVEWAMALAYWAFFPYFINALQVDPHVNDATLALWAGELG